MTSERGRLEGRRIALGVTGSIAAYKAVELLRLLQAEGADVRVLMTPAATAFIGTLTLATLSRHPVDTDVLALQDDGRIGHISAANDVQAIVVAPATAHWLGAMAHGLASDSITAACLATSVPVVVAPAMDGGMYAHPATQDNVARLLEFGYWIVEPELGPLASGLVGRGRLAELSQIVTRPWKRSAAARRRPRIALAPAPWCRQPRDRPMRRSPCARLLLPRLRQRPRSRQRSSPSPQWSPRRRPRPNRRRPTARPILRLRQRQFSRRQRASISPAATSW
jgi:hypothetical protein